MKKQLINFSWPATLSDFAEDSKQSNFSRGKLKVFYKGETADHRYFSDEFSEELVKSLPYTPVVSYYDEEKDDFVGHATEQQIYGIVDPCITPSFESDENGYTWCVCDVVLYTERPDKVGTIAQKIVGHKQSLELDPSTVKYTVNYDEKMHFKNIEFTAGTFIGVSVLGEEQQPAFTGSSFFSYNEEFENKMQLLKDYCEHKSITIHPDNGGTIMTVQEFMKLSWGDISSKLDEALFKEYGNEAYVQIVDMFDDSAIIRFYSYIDNSNKLMRIYYSCSEQGEIQLGNVNEVHITYEDVVEHTEHKEISVEQTANASEENITVVSETSEDFAGCHEDDDEEKKDKENKCEDNSEDESESKDQPIDESDEDKEKKQSECTANENVVTSEDSDVLADADVTDAAQVTNAEVTEVNEKVSVDDEESNRQEEKDSSSTSFTESERAEFEELKKEEKCRLIDSYKDILDETKYNELVNAVDNFSKDQLELLLLKEYKVFADQNFQQKTERAFAFAPILNIKAKHDSLDEWVKKNI